MASGIKQTSNSKANFERYYLDILLSTDSGSWVLTLPPVLKAHQDELEQMLSKVFGVRRDSKENFALAQQLSLNWCFSKARQAGMALEECWAEA